MFVRGGVYRVVKEALGGTLAKISVSALMFDYILTGPISGVSAGQYIAGLINDTFATADSHGWVPRAMHNLFHGVPHVDVNWTSVVFAVLVTLYFWWQNTKGIQESSEKALRVMQITTVMVIILLGWSALTLMKQGFQTVPLPTPDNLKFSNEALGFMKHTDLAQDLARKFGILGILIAFGHSVLAMSGEESLAQVNRELAHPKLKNLKRAAIIIAVYSFVFTGLTALLFVMIIPDSVRIPIYKDNLIAGLAMYQYGPVLLKLFFRAFVVVVGFLILSGAVNTAIIGSNGVLNRISEDGVLTDWFRQPHPRFGTTYRIVNLVVFLQLFTILVSHGNVYLLGEAYAFGVIWSFTFNSLAMLVLRVKYKGERGWKVPPNITIAGHEIPLGLASVFLVLLSTAIVNLFTKSIATVAGVSFAAGFFLIFTISERVNRSKHALAEQHMKEHFQLLQSDTVERSRLGIRPGNVMVTVRDYNTLESPEVGAGAHRHQRTGYCRHVGEGQPVRDRRLRSFHRADLQRLRATTLHPCRVRRRRIRQTRFAAGRAGSRSLVGHRADRKQPRSFGGGLRTLQQDDFAGAGLLPGTGLGSHARAQAAIHFSGRSPRSQSGHVPHRAAYAFAENRRRSLGAPPVAEYHSRTRLGSTASPRHPDRSSHPLRARVRRPRPPGHSAGPAKSLRSNGDDQSPG